MTFKNQDQVQDDLEMKRTSNSVRVCYVGLCVESLEPFPLLILIY